MSLEMAPGGVPTVGITRSPLRPLRLTSSCSCLKRRATASIDAAMVFPQPTAISCCDLRNNFWISQLEFLAKFVICRSHSA